MWSWSEDKCNDWDILYKYYAFDWWYKPEGVVTKFTGYHQIKIQSSTNFFLLHLPQQYFNSFFVICKWFVLIYNDHHDCWMFSVKKWLFIDLFKYDLLSFWPTWGHNPYITSVYNSPKQNSGTHILLTQFIWNLITTTERFFNLLK